MLSRTCILDYTKLVTTVIFATSSSSVYVSLMHRGGTCKACHVRAKFSNPNYGPKLGPLISGNSGWLKPYTGPGG